MDAAAADECDVASGCTFMRQPASSKEAGRAVGSPVRVVCAVAAAACATAAYRSTVSASVTVLLLVYAIGCAATAATLHARLPPPLIEGMSVAGMALAIRCW
eukprot:TRINITY_DN17849_c0_g1_i1.p2 TRINITY_DN17849_c0_g1~~TRINITY_DN17849_c0_g1_i1.p2  ORF type:complete len:102 (+),score=9.22 TRINITY_DN17849_c0_g1_i1:76-381(+)